jgi:hypothetical protein
MKTHTERLSDPRYVAAQRKRRKEPRTQRLRDAVAAIVRAEREIEASELLERLLKSPSSGP